MQIQFFRRKLAPANTFGVRQAQRWSFSFREVAFDLADARWSHKPYDMTIHLDSHGESKPRLRKRRNANFAMLVLPVPGGPYKNIDLLDTLGLSQPNKQIRTEYERCERLNQIRGMYDRFRLTLFAYTSAICSKDMGAAPA